MDKRTIFHLNKMADEYEALAKSFRIVASHLMNGHPESGQRHYDDPSLPYKGPKRKAMSEIAVRDYKGKHWMQDPKNKEKVMRTIRKMQRAKKLKYGTK